MRIYALVVTLVAIFQLFLLAGMLTRMVRLVRVLKFQKTTIDRLTGGLCRIWGIDPTARQPTERLIH